MMLKEKDVQTQQESLSHTELSQSREKKQSLRVLAIFFHPSTAVTAMGGAERRFVRTLRYFCKRKNIEFTVLESSPSLLANSDTACGKHTLSTNFHGKGWLSTYLGWILWTAKASVKSIVLARHSRPDAIFVPNNTLPNLASGYFASLILRLPLYVVAHHIDIPPTRAPDEQKPSIYECYRSIRYGMSVALAKTFAYHVTLSFLKKAKGIITVSNFTARALRMNNVSKPKIIVSGNAVDFESITNATDDVSKIYDGIFVGRIAKEKGIFDLLEVWREIAKVRKRAKLLLAGSGLELQQIREEITRTGLKDKALLHGPCTDQELYKLLSSSRVFIFPSLFEGWGIAVAEALACGLPVVAYDIPALREIFGSCKSVFLVPARNSESMASTVLDILGISEKDRCELGRFSKEYARQFSWQKIAEKDLEILPCY
jgi:glycosyltransferase involved in cell wall biosynthesis